VLAAVALVALKLGTGLATHSLGLVSEALHSGTDLVAALLTFFAVGVAVRPADVQHAYGHGKAEHLAALAEGGILVLASLFISWQAIARLAGSSVSHVNAAWYAFAVLAVVLAVDAGRTLVSWRASRRYRSAALASNALHFASDFAGTVAVLVGLVLVRAGYHRADAVAALFVAALVLLLAGTSVSVLVVSSMLLGSGQLLSMIGEQSVVAANVGPGGFDRAFSRFTFATSIGQAAGPVLILVLAGSATLPDTHALLLAATIAAALLVAVTVLLHGSDRSSRQASQGSASLGTALRVPGLGLAILVSLAVIASVDLLVVYLPVLGTERGLPASTIGALLTLRALASMGSRFFLPKLVERCGRGRLLTASIAAAALSVSCLAFHLPVAVLFVVILMVGLALGFGQPLTMAWVAEASPAEVRATALSLRLTGNRLGQTLSACRRGTLCSRIRYHRGVLGYLRRARGHRVRGPGRVSARTR